MTMQKANKRGRPQSEFRRTVMQAARQMAAEGGPFTWHDLADRLEGISRASPADCRLLRRTVENMHEAGELGKVGERSVPGSRRPMNLYMPGDGVAPERSKAKENRGEALARLLAMW